ncbi:hypothetical protein CAJAP_00707 [Camponotus japonicus]
MRICIVLLLFVYAEGVYPRTLHINKSSPITYDNSCECINKYYCGCCQFIEWDAVSLNGTLCGNASYLDHDYGISITLTYNNVTLINETVTVKDAPPICVGNFVDSVFDICLQIYDIDVDSNGFHACFEILGKIMKFEIYKLELGCIGSMLKYSISPNVIIV